MTLSMIGGVQSGYLLGTPSLQPLSKGKCCKAMTTISRELRVETE